MLHVETYLRERIRQVDEKLDALLPDADEPPPILHQAMRYAVFPGGKRIRPVLCLAAAEAVGTPSEVALVPAAAIEIFHAYTLIHDDLPCMDNDDVRRGRPTVHKVYGEACAVLAGDALQALAFELAAGCPLPNAYPDGTLVLELAGVAGSRGVVAGQMEDLQSGAGPLSEERLAFIHRHKTADLFVTSLRFGAIVGNATSEELRALSEYGLHLGHAFQILDDLLDAAHDAASSRKPAASILRVCDATRARAMADEHIEKGCAALREFPEQRIAPLLALANLMRERKQ